MVYLGAILMLAGLAFFGIGSIKVAEVARTNQKWPDLPIGVAAASYALTSLKPSNVRKAGRFSVRMIVLGLVLGLAGSVILSIGAMEYFQTMMGI